MAKRGRPPVAPHERTRRAQERVWRGREVFDLIAAEIEMTRRAGRSVLPTAALERVSVRTGRGKRTLQRDLAAYRAAAAVESKRQQVEQSLTRTLREHFPEQLREHIPEQSITALTRTLREHFPEPYITDLTRILREHFPTHSTGADRPC